MLKRIKRRVRRWAGLQSPERPKRTGVELFYWRLRDGRQNFGDHLSSAIVTKMAASRDRFLDEVAPTPRRMLAIGSILHYANDGDVIWGSGLNGSVPVERHQFQTLDVRAVRGPLTREFLQKRGIAVPEVFGDPALLTRRLLGERFATEERSDPIVFVPNFQDLPLTEGWENVVSPLQPWAEVIRRIVRAELVVSSSLHGLVIADAFGIPCTYLRLTDSENMFKYEDYALGTGRSSLKVARSREEAVRASPLDPPRPDLDRLEASFPWDLWA
jgi:pyruvyltransferase